MFIIIGGDGREYGPVTVEQIRTWMAAGRASLDTRAKALGSDEWRRVGDFAEFSSPDTVPPVIEASAHHPHGDSSTGVDLAGVGARIGAAIINALFYLACVVPGAAAKFRQLSQEYPEMAQGSMPPLEALQWDPVRDQRFIYLLLGAQLAGILLQCLLLAWRGQNLGKLITGVRVVRASDGQRAGFLRASLLRFLLPVSPFFMPGIFPLLGLLFLFVDFCFIFRADRRCLHDLIAGTKVVRRTSTGAI